MSDRNLFLLSVLMVGLVSLFLVSGCIFDSATERDDPEGSGPPEYAAPDSPENAFHNFYVAYVTRDVEGYDRVLASDFHYVFPTDYLPEQMGSCDGEWTREEELAATGALFASTEVLDLDLDLPEVSAVPCTEIGMPEDAMLIRPSGIRLGVTLEDDVTLVTSRATVYDLVFRPGLVEAGEEAGSWYLHLWRETPTAEGPSSRALAGPTPVEAAYWWEVKCDWAP